MSQENWFVAGFVYIFGLVISAGIAAENVSDDNALAQLGMCIAWPISLIVIIVGALISALKTWVVFLWKSIFE